MFLNVRYNKGKLVYSIDNKSNGEDCAMEVIAKDYHYFSDSISFNIPKLCRMTNKDFLVFGNITPISRPTLYVELSEKMVDRVLVLNFRKLLISNRIKCI